MMRTLVGVIVAACFYYSGLVKLARWLMQKSGRHLIILNYHRATGGNLRNHLLYLRRHYRMLHLDEALEELYTPLELSAGIACGQGEQEGSREGKRTRDRRTPLVLTFDDGYHDNYTHGFALACELQVPITLFLIPGYIESGDYFWWLEGKRLVHRVVCGQGEQTQVSEAAIEGRTYHLSLPQERDELAKAIDSQLRYAQSVAEREAFLGMVRKTLDVAPSVTLEEEVTMPLTWAEIRKMDESGWVSFGAHTMHHPILAYLTDPAEVQREVRECRRTLEQQLGYSVRTFAYPVGKFEDIGDEAPRAVREAGYTWAVTTVHGTNTPQSDPYRLRRVLGDVSRHRLVMAAEVSGLWHFLFHRQHQSSPALPSPGERGLLRSYLRSAGL